MGKASEYNCVTSGDTFGEERTRLSKRANLNCHSSSQLLHFSEIAIRR